MCACIGDSAFVLMECFRLTLHTAQLIRRLPWETRQMRKKVLYRKTGREGKRERESEGSVQCVYVVAEREMFLYGHLPA